MDLHTVFNMVRLHVETKSSDLDLRRSLGIPPGKVIIPCEFASQLEALIQAEAEAYIGMMTFRKNQELYPDDWASPESQSCH